MQINMKIAPVIISECINRFPRTTEVMQIVSYSQIDKF